MRTATIALAVEFKGGIPFLLDTISDSREISILEASVQVGEPDPLWKVYDHRKQQVTDDDKFSDYVEQLLSKPFLKVEVRNYGIQWLKSRIRIEQFQKDEGDAAQIIANYAFEIFTRKMDLRDFMLAGPKSQVRIRVFVLAEDQLQPQAG